jgi:hypothetical protein
MGGLLVSSLLFGCGTPAAMRAMQADKAEQRDEAAIVRRLERTVHDVFRRQDTPQTRHDLANVKIHNHNLDDFGAFTAVLSTFGPDGRLVSKGEIAGQVESGGLRSYEIERDLTPVAAGDMKALKLAVAAELERLKVYDAWLYELKELTPCAGDDRIYWVEARQIFLGGPPSRPGEHRESGGSMPAHGTFNRITHELKLVGDSQGRAVPPCPEPGKGDGSIRR